MGQPLPTRVARPRSTGARTGLATVEPDAAPEPAALALHGVGAAREGARVVARERRPVLVVLPGGAAEGTGHTLRLRGWLVAVGLAIVVALALVAGAAIGRAGAGAATTEVGGAVTIEPGQTLWDVAVTHAPPGSDPRAYLAEIRRVNDIDGRIQPWSVVLLPAPRG